MLIPGTSRPHTRLAGKLVEARTNLLLNALQQFHLGLLPPTGGGPGRGMSRLGALQFSTNSIRASRACRTPRSRRSAGHLPNSNQTADASGHNLSLGLGGRATRIGLSQHEPHQPPLAQLHVGHAIRNELPLARGRGRVIQVAEQQQVQSKQQFPKAYGSCRVWGPLNSAANTNMPMGNRRSQGTGHLPHGNCLMKKELIPTDTVPKGQASKFTVIDANRREVLCTVLGILVGV